MERVYKNRTEAGRALADELDHFAARDDLVVLALPRGGVPVAAEVAQALEAPLDVLIVRKVGLPDQEELAMGAIAFGGARTINRPVVEQAGISEDVIERLIERERRELQRQEETYRRGRPMPELKDKCVILIDDGVATGSTTRAAVEALRSLEPSEIIVAIPVAPAPALERIRNVADDVICPSTPATFAAIGDWYEDFRQLSDEHVLELLEQSPHTKAAPTLSERWFQEGLSLWRVARSRKARPW